MQVTHDTADRLLLIQPGVNRSRPALDSITSIGFTVDCVDSISKAVSALRQNPPFSALLLTYSSNNNWDPESESDKLMVLRREAGASPLIALADSLTFDQCQLLIRNGVNGIVACENGSPDLESLEDQLTSLSKVMGPGSHSASSDESTLFDVTGIVGCSRAMGDVLQRAARASQISDVPVLIYGESGTGKQLLAEAIHHLDPKRSAKDFVSVNCAAISGQLADSALFGHRKGAYTGAMEDRLGCFRSADGGTILLDEIGELDLALQPRLLRVLQESLVLPVGDDRESPVDVRVVAATNRRLEVLVEKKQFRLDLFQRLNVIAIEIPPLRERVEDIPHLAEFFLKRYADYAPIEIESIEESAMDLMTGLPFKGNVRELENLIRRALAFKASGTTLTADDLNAAVSAIPAITQGSPGSTPLVRDVVENATNMLEKGSADFDDLIDECEKLLLGRLIRQSEGSQTDLARELGLTRRTLYNKRRKHGLL